MQRGRISPANLRFLHNQDGPFDLHLDPTTLYRLCETAQAHLADATVRNAPAWRYSAILQVLRRELSRSNASVSGPGSVHSESRDGYHVTTNNPHAFSANVQDARQHPQSQHHGLVPANSLTEADVLPASSLSQHDAYVENIFLDPNTEILFDNLGTDEDLIPDFWSQFDSLPVGEYFISGFLIRIANQSSLPWMKFDELNDTYYLGPSSALRHIFRESSATKGG